MKIGIVGMPNAGKSSLFNALTKSGAEAANYPFTTIEPNVAVVPVEDERLVKLSEMLGASETVFDHVDFHDIAGLVAGAHKGEGLGNAFLANIRETDAIVHVVRAHDDENIIHSEGSVNPLRDVETIEAELILSDLDQAERRRDRVAKTARGGDAEAQAELAWLEELIPALEAGRPARSIPAPEEHPEVVRNLFPLTGKPVLFVANVDEDPSVDPETGETAFVVPEAIAAHAAAQGAGVVAVSARLEAELAEMDDEEASAMRDELGIAESGLQRVVKGAFDLLELLTFFTVGSGVRGQSWHLKRGLTSWHAAGEIHGDIQRGFVRAEIVGYDAMMAAGGLAGARDKGTLQVEGRDYVMRDGDVINVKFTP